MIDLMLACLRLSSNDERVEKAAMFVIPFGELVPLLVPSGRGERATATLEGQRDKRWNLCC